MSKQEKITALLNDEEQELIRLFRFLNTSGKLRTMENTADLIMLEKFTSKDLPKTLASIIKF